MKHLSHIVFVLILLSSLLLSSCTTIRSYEFGSSQQSGQPDGKETVHLYFSYSVGESHIQTSCSNGQKVVQHRVKLTPGQWWVGFFTLGIYTPITSNYWCG